MNGSFSLTVASVPPAGADDKYLTPEQFSELIHIPTTTLAAWRSQRKGPGFVRLGVQVRYPKYQLNLWFEELQRDATSWMSS